MPMSVRHAIMSLTAVLAAGLIGPAGATRHREAQQVETVEGRPAGEPLMAIVSLSNQRGWLDLARPGLQRPKRT